LCKFEEVGMTETRNGLFEDFSRFMNDAAEMAHGVRREAETVIKGQVERLLAKMDVVAREEFEALKEMAIAARDENDRLAKRIAALEAKLGLSQEASWGIKSDPKI
jgi:BMFP domain-containing protein YqiC